MIPLGFSNIFKLSLSLSLDCMKKGLMFGSIAFALILVMSFSVVSAGILGSWFTGNSDGITGNAAISLPPNSRLGSCLDSDNGVQGQSLFTLGAISYSFFDGSTNISLVNADECISRVGLKEYFCGGLNKKIPAYKNIRCSLVGFSNICFDGACTPKSDCKSSQLVFDRGGDVKNFILANGSIIRVVYSSVGPDGAFFEIRKDPYSSSGSFYARKFVSISSSPPGIVPGTGTIILQTRLLPRAITDPDSRVRLSLTSCNLPPNFSYCGDGIINLGGMYEQGLYEYCDGLNLNGKTCSTVDYYSKYSSGILRCTSTCQFDTTGCIV